MRAFLLGAAFTALFVPACSDSNKPDDPADPDDQQDEGPDETDEEDPPTPDESARDIDELARIIGAHVRGEFQIQLVAAEISENRFPEGFALTAAGQGSGAIGAMSYSFTFWCVAGDGTETVVACDGTAHHSHIQITMTGQQTIGEMSMDMLNRYVDWEIRDLTVDKARFRGPDNLAIGTSVTTEGVAATYTLNMDAAYEKVRFLPGAQFPTYGTIDFGINAERVRGTDRRVFLTQAQLVYGASGVPTTLVFDGAIQYSLDVQTGVVVKL